MIASLLTLEPGKGLIGEPNLTGVYEDFVQSCKEPILIAEEDDDYNKSLKNMMKETKAELCDRIAKGERLEDIIMDAHREMQRLGQYAEMLREQVNEYVRNPEHSDQDVADFIEASNKVLEQKGVAPMKLGPIARKRLKYLNENGEKKK